MDCPTDRLIEHIGDRWVLHLLHHLVRQPQRTQGLLQALKGISSRTLAAKLKMLEADGWIVRRVYPEVPPHVEYELSERGKALIPLLGAWTEAGKVLFPASEPQCPHCQHLASTEETHSMREESHAVAAPMPKARLSKAVAASVESVALSHAQQSALINQRLEVTASHESVAPTHEFVPSDDEVILL
ncbi:MAG: helix-turn-helix transcriptional regulator [Blastocatellia bacterium]|nr:helix-turn-helix transcriptional regulator [Blastocatellia bacterium]